MSAPVTPQRKLEANMQVGRDSAKVGSRVAVSVQAPTASGAGAALLAKLKAARPGCGGQKRRRGLCTLHSAHSRGILTTSLQRHDGTRSRAGRSPGMLGGSPRKTMATHTGEDQKHSRLCTMSAVYWQEVGAAT